jgi:hypothetical protein
VYTTVLGAYVIVVARLSTVIVTVAIVLPNALAAVIVQAEAAAVAVGVPVITPVVWSNVSPGGRPGLTEYEVA